jgi:hypothetical protein
VGECDRGDLGGGVVDETTSVQGDVRHPAWWERN